jgi:hypothetical protein
MQALCIATVNDESHKEIYDMVDLSEEIQSLFFVHLTEYSLLAKLR